MGEWAWEDLRRCALEAATAERDELLPNGRARRLTDRPVRIPSSGRGLDLWPVPRGRFWKQELLFLVDPALSSAAQVRHRIDQRQVRVHGGKLRLELTADLRAALGDASAVDVFYLDETGVGIMQALIENLRNAARGKLVAELWDDASERALRRPPRVLRSPRELNREQRDVLAAMTSPGGCFVWGPPGTGKTTVVGAAVRDAVARGRSVLIASALHVAVDNVVTGLLSESDRLPALLRAPGDVVRLASSATEDKVLPEVAAHDFALVDKAAAFETRYSERRAQLLRQRADDRAAPARRSLQTVLARLADVDTTAFERAIETVEACAELDGIERRVTELGHAHAAAAARCADAQRMAAGFGTAEDDLQAAARAYEIGRRALREWERTAASRAEALAATVAERELRLTEAATAEAAAESMVARLLAPLGRARRRTAIAARDRAVTAEADWRAAERAEASAARAVGEHARECDRLAGVRHDADVRLRACHRALAELRRLEPKLVALRRELDEASVHRDKLRELARALPDAEEIVSEAERSGLADDLRERDRLNDAVARLDARRRDLDDRIKQLDAELTQARARLLTTSRVVAATVDGLSMNHLIRRRRFDVVILDEGASISPAKVAYVGSLATRTFAVVGDFLQNAPIAEVDRRAGGQGARTGLDWRRRSVFELAGIRDRASAERHPACVSLREQHRFPAIVADAVNAFCYEGLLLTRAVRDPGRFPVTLVDTAHHPGKRLVSAQASWRSPLGLDLMAAIAHGRRSTGRSIGFICPYAPQARAAEQRSRADGLGVRCGTSHRFQGREFDIVIADLMQDDRRRWVGVADLHGDDRAVSGAKLLNVALTRAKEETFLIADWNFVRSSHAPGMRAIAALEGRDGFRVLPAETLLAYGARARGASRPSQPR